MKRPPKVVKPHGCLPRPAHRRTTSGAGAAAGMVGLALLLDLPVDSAWGPWTVALVTVLACLAYMALHELTHAGLLWALTGTRPTVGVRLPYLVTGSQALLSRRTATTVALGPLVLWGLVLLGLLAVVPDQVFLTGYVLAGLNLAGSAGDLLQAWRVGRLPSSALVRDDGRRTTVHLPTD
ncbi:DUF3267 domain-containing protein [Ornithinimicrobium sp. CNJ-824]|uniref:DUF3267 domain-containing protein n=1 Tax=Ornithinimicrobium sp. CNJ-824 TaxID=1904966 RepID=UPI00117BE577|nr:DUF3267 domain-containing protein [Ornithinimicrobium sp. CNJ-824]